MELFHFKRQRKLSLRFLAAYLLGLDIQHDTHDSIEDSRTALALFHKYARRFSPSLPLSWHDAQHRAHVDGERRQSAPDRAA